MLISLIIYVFLLFAMLALGKFQITYRINPRKNIPVLYMFLPSMVFAVVFGCRYGVGTDHLNYINEYIYGHNRNLEWGFLLVENFFNNRGLHFAWFFGFLAFLQVSLFLSSFRDRDLFPFVIIVLILSTQWLGWCNGIRQAVATCFFIYSIQFIYERKLLQYCICCLFAISFHKSAIVLLPFYFFYKIDLGKIKWIPWLLFFSALVIGEFHLFDSILERWFVPVSELLGYDEVYSLDSAFTQLENSNGTGLGRILSLIITVLILKFAPSVREFFIDKNSNDVFSLLYSIFLIGMFGGIAFSGVVVLLRIFGYFNVFKNVVLPYTMFYLIKGPEKKYNRIIGYSILFILAILFFAVIYRGSINTAEYHTFWNA